MTPITKPILSENFKEEAAPDEVAALGDHLGIKGLLANQAASNLWASNCLDHLLTKYPKMITVVTPMVHKWHTQTQIDVLAHEK